MTSTINNTLVASIVMLCLTGVLVSGLALGEHYNTKPSPCSINDKWDCGIVNHSPYATLRGIPVALIGSLGFALIAALAGRLPRITAVLAFLALLFSLRLTWIEWKTLGVWCIYCVSSQAIIALVFLLTLLAAALSRRRA
ncbi:MAG TPA: vitamin K epoxide reductase family protein [Terriglobales bacterium]|jgi:vitamin-K-epoxide reductase (warfarin-sensitive)|nr:vitamin K epoxide reductase family protein [Terriglobales bacterium]